MENTKSEGQFGRFSSAFKIEKPVDASGTWQVDDVCLEEHPFASSGPGVTALFHLAESAPLLFSKTETCKVSNSKSLF